MGTDEGVCLRLGLRHTQPIRQLGVGIAPNSLRRGLTKRVIHQMTALLGKVVRRRQLGRDTNQMGLDQQ